MQFEELTCSLCQGQYSVSGEKVPRLLPECGHTFCTACLNNLLRQSEGDFFCPEDQTHCTRKESAEYFPKNFALLRLAEKTIAKYKLSENLQSQSKTKGLEKTKSNPQDNTQEEPEEELCQQHKRKLEIICIDDNARICSNCALFGNHKNHDIRMESDVLQEIQVRTECLMDMYQLMEQNCSTKADPSEVEDRYSEFNEKGQELKQLVKDKFKEIKASIKIQEQAAEDTLKRNLQHIDSQFRVIREAPKKLYDDAEKWLKFARVKLDNFTQKSQDPNYIAFEMLENKLAQPLSQELTPSQDIIQSGEKILMQLENQKDVSLPKIDNMIKQLNVEFNSNAIKQLNEVCKCELISDLSEQENRRDFTSEQKQSQHKTQNYNQQKSNENQYAKSKTVNRQSIAFGEDDNDLLSDLSFNIEPTSPTPQNQEKMSQEQNFKRSSTVIPKDNIQSSNNQKQNLKVMQNQQQTQEQQVQEKEEINEELINDIENYLKEVIEQNEKVMDISETQIGNYGARCVAEVITLCDSLEEIRLSGCSIKDEGAIKIFDELKSSETVLAVDLNNNKLSEKIFDSLVQLMNSNKKIERVEIKGLNIRNRFAANKLKQFQDRIIM